MPSLLEILQDPNYVNANEATKEAIFNKYSAQDKNYSDANDATKEAIRTKFGVGAPVAVAEPEPTKDTGIFSMTGRAIARGAKQTGSLLADVLPAMAAKAVGADEYAAKQMEEAAQTQKEIEQNYGARYKSLSDVKSIGDYIPFALETAAEQIPGMATALVPGLGLGAVGGRMAATAAAKKLAEREVATQAGAKYAAMKTAEGVGRGQIGGAFLGSYALNAPEVFQNIYEETGQMETGAALLAGSVSAALDSILPVAILKQLGPSAKAGVVEKILERSGMPSEVARKVVGATIGSAATEGLTEGAQEAISITAEKFVQENPDIWGSKEFNRIVESSVRGAVGGGAFGAAGSGAGAYLEGRRERKLESVREPGRSAIDEARDYGNTTDTGADKSGVPLSDQEKLRKDPTDAGAGGVDEAELDRINRLAADARIREEEFNNQLNELATREVGLVKQLNDIKGYIREISEVDPTDERITGAEQQFGQIDSELQALRGAKTELENQNKIRSLEAPEQMGLDFNAPEEPPTDQEMQDAGFTQYEIEQLKKNPWPERYQQIKQGYRMIGGQFRQVTQEDVDQVKQSNINKQQIKADKKAQLDAAFAQDPRDGVSQILGSDWNRKFNLSTEEYQKHAYDTLERQYGSIDSGVVMLERRLAAAQSTKPKQEAPEFELTGEGRVPEMEGIEEVPEGERARMMLIGAPGDPVRPVRNLFDSLKSASANPAESIKFKTEVRKFLDDVTEFIGGRMAKQVSRYQEVDSEGRPIGPPPEPPKGQDVGVRLSGPELTRRMNFLNNFFDNLSIAPKERETLTSALSQQVGNMSAKEQSEIIGSLTKLKNINTRHGMEKLRGMFSSAIDKFERGRIGEAGAEAVLPFKASEDITNLDPYIAAAVSRAIKSIDTSTPEGKAAMAYFGLETGWRYGLAMRSAAFDLAVPITDYTGVTFKGQNKGQAELFKKWAEDNLPQQEYKKFEATIKEFTETNRRANQALENANTRKASRIDPSYLKALYRRPTGKEEIQAFPAGMKGMYTAAGQGKKGLSNKDFGLVHDIQFAVMHPAIQERIEANDINGALRMIAEQKIEYRKKTGEKESGTYTQFISGLAKRLLELNLTTDVVVNQQNKLTAYYIQRNAKGQRAQFINQLSSFPWGKEFIAKHNLRGDLNDPAIVRQTLQVLEDIASSKISFGKDDVIPPIAGQFAQLLKTYRDAVANLNSQGFFFAGMNTINLNTERGGMSAATFLHEVVHAATLYSLIPANYDSLGPAQKAAVNELRELFEYAKKKYEGTAAAGAYGFENVYEFVSEAMSNPDFQEFLQVLKYETKYKGGKALSLWNKFIGLVGKLFGLDNVLGKTLANANAIMRTSTKDDTAVIAYSNAGKYTMNSTMPYNSTQYMGLMNTILTGRLTWSGVKDRLRNVYVGALTLRQISDIMGDRVPKIKEFINSVENMLEYRNNILEEVKSEIKPWQEFQSESPTKAQIMSKLMIDSTVAKKDPSKRDANGNFIKTGDKLIDDAWQEIGPRGQKIYEDVKLFYKRRYDAYVDMLLENKMLALMADGFTKAEALINPEYVGLKKHFQDQSIEPYFPLRRFGEYSVRLMRDKQRSFYMFESPEQRDAFVKSVIPILEKKYGKSFDPERDIGLSNGSRDMLYSENLQNAESLSTLKDLIKTTPSTDVMGLKGPDEVTLRDNLTKAIEDLYLLQIPDQSIRKMFMNRENIPGMDLDMLRAFTSSAFHMAYQHSRFKYSRPIYNSLDAATTQIGELNREEGKVLSEYMKEIRQHRINYIMNPIDTGKTAARLSNLSFLWFMTSPASAITNMLGVPAVGLPVVGAKFGNMKALATMAAYSKRVLGTGFKDKDGKFASPSLSNRLDILSEAQKEAYQRAVADGIIDITLSHDIVGLAETPSALYQEGAEHAVMKYASSIFHGAEKFNREVVFMSSFDLAYQQYKNKGYNEEGARKKAIEVAKELTYKSMFDYSTLNKPRFLQGPAAKVIFQFKQFSQQMTYLLTRSAFETMYKEFTPTEKALIKEQIKEEDKAFRTEQPRMTDKELDAAVEKYIADFRKEARSRLLGVYGTTAVFAGASGLPLWWVVSSTANALQAVFGEDDDEDWDFDIWFKEWTNETFGGFFGDVMARGAVSQLTGANVADRLSLNGLWFRDVRKNEDEVSWVQNQMINLLGPTAGLVVNWAEAAKQYNQGYLDRAIETVSPAVIKNFLKGMRLSETFGEGRATNLKGDELVGDITGVEALYQTIGFAPERVAQQQKVNIDRKTIDQNILKRQARLRDAFFMAVDNDDDDLRERTLEKIAEFNQRYPEKTIKPKDIMKSIKGRYKRRALAESMGGMTFDKKLIGRLSEFGSYGDSED